MSLLPRREKGFCELVTIYVQNAFIMIPRRGLSEDIKKGNTKLFVWMICSYLSERTLIIVVPQWSFLGSLLCKINCDEVLRLPMTEGAIIIRYADDLAIVAMADLYAYLKFLLNIWLKLKMNGVSRRLHLAPQVLLAGGIK